MNKLIIPQLKDNKFSIDLFNSISVGLNELRNETNKLPDKITFYGKLGKSIFGHIKLMNWDLKVFNPTHLNGANKIIISYSKPIDQIKEVGKTIFDDSLHNKKIKGIPSTKTISTINKTYFNFNYTIEKKISPIYEIFLHSN